MRLFINQYTFISVIPTELGYSCQVMNLLNGIGMYSLSIIDNKKDAVSTINMNYPVFTCSTLEKVFEYHKDILLYSNELTEADYFNGDESNNFLQ